MRNSLSNSHPGSKLIFALFIIVTSFLVTFLIGFLFAIPIFHININDLSSVFSDYGDPDNLRFLKYLQTIQAFGLFIIPAFIIAYLFHSKSSQYFGFDINVSSKSIFLSIFILIAFIPIINSLAAVNQSMQLPEWLSGFENWIRESEDKATRVTEAFLEMNSVTSLVFNLIMIAALPAIGEELIFRGIFQRIFAEWTKNIHWGIIIAAMLFSALHFQFYGFLPRMILGVLLGYLFYWSGSIWIPIIGHFVNNAAAVIVYYFYADEITNNIESFGISQGSYGYLIISVIVVSAALYTFYQENKKQAKY